MVAAQIPYDQYIEGPYEHLQMVRRLGPWLFETVRCHGVVLLAAVNLEERAVFEYRYTSAVEFARDVALLLSVPPADGDDAGVGARVTPPPPSRTAGYEEPLPLPEEKWEDQSSTFPREQAIFRNCRGRSRF